MSVQRLHNEMLLSKKKNTVIIEISDERTFNGIGKLENPKLEMKRLNVDILGICEVRWKEGNDFQSGKYSVINTVSKKEQAEVGI